MHPTRVTLIQALAGGRFYSGQDLADRLGISRSAVWKHVKALEKLGLEVFCVRGKGYRLAQPIVLLEEQHILSACDAHWSERLAGLSVLQSTDSTNTWLKDKHDYTAPGIFACFSEHQTAGRGRRGRSWVSPFGANLYFSVSWPFPQLPPDFAALSLVVAVSVKQALEEFAVRDVELKWPNDIYVNGGKLGGILLEVVGEPPGACRVIIGIGLNVDMPASARQNIDQAWTDLRASCADLPDRNVLAGRLLSRLFTALHLFQEEGFAVFRDQWDSADMLAGKAVAIKVADRTVAGRAAGIDQDGALLVRRGEDEMRFTSGDVSLRVTHELVN
ncbi:MAG: bifunctional biotin--[acetyl-CoA-carboxylase] ligase/biotin operon repressor BirA [Gammaproteobacteria bacterium]|nr:bifunctional biotin--[acetyl-CoA-carboxylase] ligase/biotin operon repressor BirA [Gammaproteobacteria bacterium]